jgi:hypothetical protein
VRAIAQLHADREIEPGWAAAEASNLHGIAAVMLEAAKGWHDADDISSLNI